MPRKSRRLARSNVVRRWLAVGALVLIALLYYRPIKAYIDAQGQLGQGKQIVQKLRADKARLERQLGSSNSLPTLAREARALGYVRPGERLYIVKGINHWRKQQRASMMAHRGH
jgi:cell division protein FtsB